MVMPRATTESEPRVDGGGEKEVRETGLEPARYYYHQALNLARLPIPPFPRRVSKRAYRAYFLTLPLFSIRSPVSQAGESLRPCGSDLVASR